MLDHIGIVISDLERGKRFYQAVLEPLRRRLLEDHTQGDGTGWLVFGSGIRHSPFFVVAAGRPSFWNSKSVPGKSPIHLASKESVD
jgi:catechol 2,3-dioxygenase-like lactoylglutathione lyase family enzyme